MSVGEWIVCFCSCPAHRYMQRYLGFGRLVLLCCTYCYVSYIYIFYFRYGHFSGINRKIQLKYQPRGFSSASSAEESESSSLCL